MELQKEKDSIANIQDELRMKQKQLEEQYSKLQTQQEEQSKIQQQERQKQLASIQERELDEVAVQVNILSFCFYALMDIETNSNIRCS